METESRRKGPRSPSVDSDDSSHRRRSRKYDRSPSPRRSRYRRSRSRDRRSGSRERRRKESSRSQDWKQVPQPSQPAAPPASAASTTYAPAVHNQYQAPLPPNTSQPPPPIPAYNPGYNNYNYNYSQGYDYNYQQPPPTGYRSDYPPPNWASGQVPYNNQQAPPAPTMPPHPGRNVDASSTGLSAPPSRPEDAKKEAIAAEAKQQKATLAKQREEYVKKSTILQRELETLRQQCDEIGKEGGRENNRIIKENQKLQIEIQNKMKTIHNVIDMLTGIIGDKVTIDDLRSKFKSEATMKRAKSPKEEFPKGKSESPGKSSDSEKEARIERERKSIEDAKPMYNFVHYDPEMHWCKICDIFPKTAKEYLNHLHTNEHKNACLERKIVDMPWHERNGEEAEKHVPEYPGLPTKRTPIKGLQFFSAATSWYCKLCNSWIGDLHCASLHLKSKKHSENFARFVEQNPHWETDWMADRERAFSEERRKQMQLELHKQKDEEVLPPKSKKSKKWKKNKKKSKKRKNRSSASDTTSDTENTESDSDHDMSKSIRVAMRNKMKASTQAILNEEIDYHGIKLKGSWAQVAQVKTPATPEMPPPENDDRQLLNSIRDKLKAKQEEEMKNSNNRKQSMEKLVLSPPPMPKEEIKSNSSKKVAEGLEAWGPKEPPKPFWIKKDEEKPQAPQPAAPTSKSMDVPKPDEMPKPHMGFWTKQQVNMAVKPPEGKSTVSPEKEEEPRERGSDRSDRYKEERDRKYDRREDKYERSDRYERRRGGSGRDRDRDRERDRDSDYYDDRRKSRYSNDSPRREKNWRDSPKRSYDKYSSSKDSRREENNSSNDESKFEKKTNESATKLKKGSSSQSKKSAPAPAKGKLPFIGRLPLFKKKNEEPKIEKADIAPLPYQQSKFEDTPKVPSEIINPPGVVHITKLATPVNLNSSIPVKVVPAPIKILVAPPPPTLHNDLKNSAQAPALPTQQVVDMEIEDQSEETIIEEPVIGQQEQQLHKIPEPSPPVELPALPPHPPPTLTRPPPSFPPAVIPQAPPPQILPQIPAQIPPQPVFTPNRPPPFIATAPPPFVPAAAAKFTVRPPPTQTHPSYVTPHDGAALAAAAASYAQAHGNPPPPMTPIVDSTSTDIADIPEPAEKRPDPSMPLPDDLQEALNIIFPKEETADTKTATNQTSNLPDTNVMYASMYSILGCVGYGPEYMDIPPPEITQADTDVEAQPGPDDLRMLGIDEGDTIF